MSVFFVNMFSLDLDDTTNKLYELHRQHNKGIFECSLEIKELLPPSTQPLDTIATPGETQGIKLPKVDVPKFDGNVVNWTMFGSNYLFQSTAVPTSQALKH